MNFSVITDFLKNYDGPDMAIMEVCGSHTGRLQRTGFRLCCRRIFVF